MNKKTFWDRLGVGISLICVIHCVLFPLLLVLLPVWSLFDAVHAWAHPVLLVTVIPIAILSCRGRDVPSKNKMLFILGVVFLAFAWISHGFINPLGEVLITLLGSTVLIIAHVKNYKFHQLHRSKSSVCPIE